MSTFELRQYADRDDQWPGELAPTAWPDGEDSPIVIEDLDHPAPVTAAYTFCG